MDFHGIDTKGKIWLERINSKPVFNNNWIGRIIYTLDNHTLSLGTSAGWVDIVSATQGGLTTISVPSGEIILFEKDTAVVGYTLLTDKDDMIVYITKGSALGGESGATDKIGGTWTQPVHAHSYNAGSHNHSSGAHIHSVGSHTHPFQTVTISNIDPSPGLAASFVRYPGAGSYLVTREIGTGVASDSNAVDSDGVGPGTGNTGTGSGNTGNASVSGVTGNSSPSSTWRPEGRNWTRQQRN